jgi:bacillopeptidase F
VRNLAFLVVLLVSSLVSANALIDPSLRTFAGARGGIESTQRVLFLVNPKAVGERPARYDRMNVIRYYRESSKAAVMPVLEAAQNGKLPGVKILNVFWINQSILADVTPEGLDNLSHEDGVTKIYRNARTTRDPFLPARNGRLDGAEEAYAFDSIGVTKLAQEMPQADGRGVIVGVVDTGVDASHPALQGKIPLFYDGATQKVGQPQDYDQHGTHVSGTIAGGDRKSNNIGVAPGAKIVMAGVVEQGFDAMLAGMQWFLDADKNPVVAQKVKVVGCSWNTSGAPDQEPFYRAIAAWEASGILPVFSAGNEGNDGITNPHEYPGTFAVAAYGADGNIADFSSRGPGHYKGKDTQKPDIAAPGVDINSSIPGGQYEKFSGTSMAQPHVTGTVALMLQANPNLNPAQLRDLLVHTASPAQGQQPGQWNNTFGFGKLNTYNAVKAALAAHMENLGNLFLGDTQFFNTPKELSQKFFATENLGPVDSDVDHFGATDTSRWLTAEEIYGR